MTKEVGERMENGRVWHSSRGAGFAWIMVGIAVASLAIVGIILYMASSQTRDSYAGRAEEAIAIAKGSDVGGVTLEQRASQVVEKRKQAGVEVTSVSWHAKQGDGSNYYVTFSWEEGSLRERKSAVWRVDIGSKTVEPYNSEAKGIAGTG